MSDGPISLAEARALKANDSRLWTPIDCARAFLRDIESGAINPRDVAIWFNEPDGEGSTLRYYTANLTLEGHVYLLNHALRQTLSNGVG